MAQERDGCWRFPKAIPRASSRWSGRGVMAFGQGLRDHIFFRWRAELGEIHEINKVERADPYGFSLEPLAHVSTW